MANNVPLSPVSFLERSGTVFPERPAAITAGGDTETYGAFLAEARHVADRLRAAQVGPGRHVAVLARNGPDALRMHFAVPGAGSSLVALNIRLSSEEYAYILDNSDAVILFVEPELRERIRPVVDSLTCTIVDLPSSNGVSDDRPLGTPYDAWLSETPVTGRPLALPDQENAPISINYTSGTTGRPKGAIYTHRGAYLNALGVALELGFDPESTYLWTLPMFHCNGWCCTWAVTAVGGTHITLADFDASMALTLIERHEVTHLCGAPVVLNSLAEQGAKEQRRFDHAVRIATGGAPPSPTTIAAMNDLGLEVRHLYGLTETYGPSIVCEVQADWSMLDSTDLAGRMARQGVRTLNVEGVRVVDSGFEDVPRDAATMGEIVVWSNTVVPGYYGDAEQTEGAFTDGWFLTGDLAVVHPDGYVEIRDRRKDVIISGGENVSSVEVENVLHSHPDVSEVAVVGAPDDKWGEVPVAYVVRRAESKVNEEDLIDHVRAHLAHFKAPKAVVFEDLPKTSTGKIQKYELRKRARQWAAG